MQSLELRIIPVIQFGFTSLLIWLTGRLFPVSMFNLPYSLLVSSLLITIAASIGLLAIIAFKQADTTTSPRFPNQANKLITTGIYGFSRNPMYLALFFMLLAFSYYFGQIASLFLLPFFCFYINRFQIIPEEKAMRVKFGNEFDLYCLRVRKWL